MSTPQRERQKAQTRAAMRAKRRAVNRLIEMHPEEYDALYRTEAAVEGVTARGRRQEVRS